MRPVRMMWLMTWTLSGVSGTSAHAQNAAECEFTRDVSARAAMSTADALRASAGAGSLEVRGVQGLREVRVSGTACASSSQLLGQLEVRVRREGARVIVQTVFPDDRGDEQAQIDVVIEVPAGVDAHISDGSGSAGIANLGSVEVQDGSGELTIAGISGTLTVNDGSGSLEISDVASDIRITDGSGEVSIRDARANVEVTDGSGSIDVRGVGGAFVVARDGSGGIDWSNVRGRVQVPEKHNR